MNKSPPSDNRHPHPFPPQWAGSWGDDRYGLWAQFELQGERQSVQQRMRWIEPGEFLMGAAKGEIDSRPNEHPQHLVFITQGFWLANTACTQALWHKLLHENPSKFVEKNGFISSNPVENVNWEMVQVFLQELSRNLNGCCATLPTEAEWEYACRAGSHTPFSFGDYINSSQVNFDGHYPYADGPESENRQCTIGVRSLPANAWGLYQMHGNVWEWCADILREYSDEPAVNPGMDYVMAFDGSSDQQRVVRGGSWFNRALYTRSASRSGYGTEWRELSLGFRIVIRPPA